MQKPVEKPIKFIKNLETKGKSYPITHVSAVIDDNGESVKSTIDSLKNKGSLTKVTWLELKDKRDAGKLIPGSLYRITDYNCTTTQENTQSAGHQFDIVLLALSENKLAEEGWAMMHIDNIYKVVFDDNEVVSCYITPIANHPNIYYMVNVDTLLGAEMTITPDMIDEANKTITLNAGWSPDVLVDPDLPYNYFQHSNLSAWKVWYCLDNDKSRFAWADDSVDDKMIISFEVDGFGKITIPRKESEDAVVGGIQGYAWGYPNENTAYTTSEQPVIGDKVYDILGKEFIELSTIESVSEPTGLPNGRGVIYRLIDEWNNDVPYDFKNIQFKTKLDSDGFYNINGDDSWTYSLNCYDVDNSICYDASIICATLVVSDMTLDCNNNFISCIIADRKSTLQYNQIFTNYSFGDEIINSAYFVKIFDSKHVTIGFCNNIRTHDCSSFNVKYGGDGIYINNKKVLTES